MNEHEAQVFGSSLDSPGSYLRDLRDPRSGAYLAPVSLLPGVGSVHADGVTGAGQRIAVLDTGVWHEHPVIRASLDEAIDLTGEGPDDQSGHGTVSALIALSAAPQARLVSIKVLDRRGRGSKQRLIDGLERARSAGLRTINLSAGVFDTSCRGDCALCAATRACNDAGSLVVAAAGNRAGVTACPAKLAFLPGEPGFAVAAYDLRAGRLIHDSGSGSFAGPAGTFELVPVGAGQEG